MNKILHIICVVLLPLLWNINANAQCDFLSGCGADPFLSIDPPVFDATNLSINMDNVTFGGFSCDMSSGFESGVVVYVYQLLPDGTRVSNCAVEDPPFNVVASVGISFGPSSFCDIPPFNIGTIPVDPSIGFEACDGALLEIEAVLYLTENLDFDPNNSSVYSELSSNEFISIDLGIIDININNEFPGGGQPLTTSRVKDFYSDEEETINLECGQNIELYLEGLSRIANCPPYSDLAVGLTSELTNEFFYTINGGEPVIIRDPSMGAAGGELTGPDPVLNDFCYTGILSSATTPFTLEFSELPANLCDGSNIEFTLRTTDFFTNVTVEDKFNVIYTGGSGCGASCAAPPHCDNPCYAEYNPTPDDGSEADAAECITLLDCAAIAANSLVETCAALVNCTEGCTDMDACNFDPEAQIDNGSCDFGDENCDDPCNPVLGCTNPDACNFNIDACVDDGTCDDERSDCIDPCNPVLGCIDVTACNFNADACLDDDSCEYGNDACSDPCNPVSGCTDATACNFDADACVNDDSCEFGDAACSDPCNPVPGCTDATACNFDVNACVNDDSCEFGDVACSDPCNPVSGCTDVTACNFDMDACVNDDTCEFGDAACSDPCNPVSGCTDATACNFDENACVNDDSCEYGNEDCSDPCNPVMGCTDANACNFDANACINDDSCEFGNEDCSDPCNPVSGCTDNTACNYNVDACIDDNSCAFAPCNPGCTDPCAANYDATADEDNGTCEPYNMECNTDCTAGDIEIWDSATCACLVDVVTIVGCIDATACNYNPDVNCDDGSCSFGNNTACADPCNTPDPDDGCDITVDSIDEATCTIINEPTCPEGQDFDEATCTCSIIDIAGCTNPCAPSYNPDATIDDGSCEAIDFDCNQDCTEGDIEIWDQVTCSCVVETITVLGCTDPSATNYYNEANCDDGSCVLENCTPPQTGTFDCE